MKRRKTTIFVLIVLFASMLFFVGSDETYEAATSYMNAKEFYDSTALDGEPYHSESVNGTIYYATYAKLASSSVNTKYSTVGFDITLSGNGHSVSFAVQRNGGSVKLVNQVDSGGYQYDLYAVEDDILFDLATKADAVNAAYVLDTSVIDVRIDTIMVTKKGNTQSGGITENGYGGITKWGTIYRLKNSEDLKALKSIFSGHEFKSYKEILSRLQNPQLQIRYNILGLNSIGATPILSSGYSTNASGILQQNGNTYITKARVLQKMTLLNHGTIGLSKKGYHLPSGKEWITNDNRTFVAGSSYMPKVLDPVVGTKDHGITLYSNWKPNTYQVIYNANKGTGTVAPSNMVYDVSGTLRTNTFYRPGYYLPEDEEWVDSNGNTYSNGQSVSNLTANHGDKIILYANWQPCVYKITTDKQSGLGGDNSFYEKYETSFYLDEASTFAITGITIPTKTGHTFLGYYSGVNGGILFVDSTGKINVTNTFFKKDTTVHANWQVNQYAVNFDKQGGEYGSASTIATYGDLFPTADAPVRSGYTFKGYFTQINGKGTCIYNEYMTTDKRYSYTEDTTLYAYWVDDVRPDVVSNVSIETWTNQEVMITADAWDYGGGLESLAIYRINSDNTLTEVAAVQNLNGVKFQTLSYVNITEGIVRYKAVAVDINGNIVESYSVVYYDTTAPAGNVVEEQVEDNKFYFDIDITDINPGN